jgi:hypothetical protein
MISLGFFFIGKVFSTKRESLVKSVMDTCLQPTADPDYPKCANDLIRLCAGDDEIPKNLYCGIVTDLEQTLPHVPNFESLFKTKYTAQWIQIAELKFQVDDLIKTLEILGAKQNNQEITCEYSGPWLAVTVHEPPPNVEKTSFIYYLSNEIANLFPTVETRDSKLGGRKPAGNVLTVSNSEKDESNSSSGTESTEGITCSWTDEVIFTPGKPRSEKIEEFTKLKTEIDGIITNPKIVDFMESQDFQIRLKDLRNSLGNLKSQLMERTIQAE